MRTDYAYAFGRVTAMGTHLLPKAFFERQLGENTNSILSNLRDSSLRVSFGKLDSIEDFEIALNDELKAMYDFLEDVCPQKEIIKSLRLRYDFQNLKIILEEKFAGVENSACLFDVAVFDPEDLKKHILEENFHMIDNSIKDVVHKALQLYEEHNDIKIVNLFLDKEMWESLLKQPTISDHDYLVNYFKSEIDLINISTFLRSKATKDNSGYMEQALIPNGYIDLDRLAKYSYEGGLDDFINDIKKSVYGPVLIDGLKNWPQDKSLDSLENASKKYLNQQLDKIKYIPFGFEPLFIYLVSKETEINNVRCLLKAKLAGLDNEYIIQSIGL